MFDEGFGPEVEKLIDPVMRNGGQVVFVTATLSKAINDLLERKFPGLTRITTKSLNRAVRAPRGGSLRGRGGGRSARAWRPDGRASAPAPPQVEGARHRFIQVPGNEDKLRILNMARAAKPHPTPCALPRESRAEVSHLLPPPKPRPRRQVVGKEARAGNRTLVFCNTLDSCRAVGAPAGPRARPRAPPPLPHWVFPLAQRRPGKPPTPRARTAEHALSESGMRTVHYHGDMSSDARMLSVRSFSAAPGEEDDGGDLAEPGPLVMVRLGGRTPPPAALSPPHTLVCHAGEGGQRTAHARVRPPGYPAQLARAEPAGRRPAPQVCTDLAARGLDFGCRVDHIVNFDFPRSNVDYLHRAGRTARAGAKGDITSLVGKRDKAIAAAVEELVKAGGALEGEKARAKAKPRPKVGGPGGAPGRRGVGRVGGFGGGGAGKPGGKRAGAYAAVGGGRGGARGAGGRPAGAGAGGRTTGGGAAGGGGAARRPAVGAAGGGRKAAPAGSGGRGKW